tara:strand:+ start:518 stop:715 length:198 start_codon:yes stop_codon:yes gene_type:complete
MKLFKERGIISFFFASILSVSAQIKLPELISGGMILQRDTKIKIRKTKIMVSVVINFPLFWFFLF